MLFKKGGVTVSINERIKEVRKVSGLSQIAFAERIGISSSGMSKLEKGDNNPADRTVKLICTEFNVRRQWLEEGVGPMRMEVTEDDEIVDEVLAGEDEFIKAVIRGIAKTPGGWDKMKEVFTAIQAELNKQKPEP